MTLLPGLIDVHVHLTSDAEIRGYRHYQYTDNFWTVVGVANAKTTLEAGFTTVRNVGSNHFDDVALRQAIDAGEIPGPRIVTAAYAIGATGGHCDNATLPPSYDRQGRLDRRQPRRSAGEGPLAPQVRRAGHQDLRDRRGVLDRRRGRRAAADL